MQPSKPALEVMLNSSAIQEAINHAWVNTSVLSIQEINPDCSGYHLECQQVANFFAGKTWKQITWQELSEYCGDPSVCLYFMSHIAFQKFIPSYMRITLGNYYEADVTSEAALRVLIPPEELSEMEPWSKKMSVFSQDQKMVILQFLQFMQQEHAEDFHPQQGLTLAISYWQNAL